MGETYLARCEKCGHEFRVSDGGGFLFHLLGCNRCGKTKSISFKEIGEPHLRYIKGLGMPYCIASAESDRKIQEGYPGEPISEKEYHLIVEKIAGKCNCGGKYKFNARPRCPKCRSVAIKDTGKERIMYD